MNLRRNKTHTHEETARFAVRANAYLGAAQLIAAAVTGNIGFATEAVHQGADSASFKAKADAMNHNHSPEKAYRLRKLAAKILLAGGLAGMAGGAYQLETNTRESHGSIEVGVAMIGAAVNTAIARRSHKSHHDHDRSGEENTSDHSAGAVIDSGLHIMTDMGTGWVYAAALACEPRWPGISSGAIFVNGFAATAAGTVTLRRIESDNNNCSHEH